MRAQQGVSWRVGVRRTGGRVRRLVVAAGFTAAAAVAMPSAVATTTTVATVAVTVRIDAAVTTPELVLQAVDGGLRGEYAALDTFAATVPTGSLDLIRAQPGVIEVTTDAAPNTDPVTEPVALNRGSQSMGFVDADHGHGEGGNSFSSLTLANVAKLVNADRAWRTTLGAGVDIALIDTGVAPVDGVGSVVNGPDISFDAGNPSLTHLDAYGHGTHLAGILNGDTAAAPGLAPASRVVNVRVGAANGAVDVSQTIAAIDWVVQHRNSNGLNIRVLVLAYGTDGTQPHTVDPLAFAVENAWRHGIVVVIAAGNRGDSTTSLNNAALDPWVIAVGASEPNGTFSTADDTVAPFTNRGSAARGVDLLAPGRSVVSLRVPGSYVDLAHPEGRVGDALFRGSGTSQAAAVVGAAAALVLEDRPSLTPDQVKWLLTTTARPLVHVDPALQGAGVVDVAEAVLRPAQDVSQTWPVGDGSGTLEGARGTYHVVDPSGALLHGEISVFGGTSWSGTSWSGTSWSGTSWSGGSWSGTSWSGTSWSGGAWLGTSWSGQSWSGQSWSGQSWSGTSWSGTSWSGTSWSGTSWSGTSWSGTSWSGTSWSGTSWSSLTTGA